MHIMYDNIKIQKSNFYFHLNICKPHNFCQHEKGNSVDTLCVSPCVNTYFPLIARTMSVLITEINNVMSPKYEKHCEAFWITTALWDILLSGFNVSMVKNKSDLRSIMSLMDDFDWFEFFPLHTKPKALFVFMEVQNWHYFTKVIMDTLYTVNVY